MLGEREGGNETYIAGLLAGIAGLGDQGVAVSALYGPEYAAAPAGAIRPVRLRGAGNLGRVFGEIPRLARSLHADVAHLTYNAPPYLRCGLVLSVHDVIFRLYPRFFSPRVRLLLATLLPLSMLRADAIVTISEASRRDIERFYPFARGKVAVTPLAAGPVAATEPDYAGVAGLLGAGEFILAVGTLQPRKNLGRLIEAYLRARERRSIDARLVIVGRAAWRHSELFGLVQNSRFRDDVVFAGYLDEPAIAALYRRCAVFVYPSLYEGFGLPVLEAMACGAPVITSTTSSLPEVAGDAALLVDPLSVDAIGAALDAVVQDGARRDAMRERGLMRAAMFEWTSTARSTLDIYRQVVARRKP